MRPFKNILIYQFDEPFMMDSSELEALLSEYPLRECGDDELETYGWLPAFSQGENLVETIHNAHFIRLGMEVKKLPRRAIQTAVEKRAREHELDLYDRARLKELEEVITNEFIRNAYPEQSSIMAYIDREKNWLVIDATSEKKASLVTAVLRKTLGALPVVGYAPQVEMALLMTDWVQNGLSDTRFQFLDEIELKELNKEEGGVARYRGIPLDSKEIELNISEGWSVTKVGLAYQELVTFSLAEDFILKRVRYLDQFQERLELSDDQNAVAQSNGYLLVDTVRQLVTDLYNLCYQSTPTSQA
ncbi:recombination-associated protein RdgC [Ignatzschineria cameli]|uniref:Recombination-associated protein RdgC n=2 Tax=Bacteria TaxID=2 RepID=A0ABX5L0E0_9GAMM|nr:recombination-associated protein RdgC [Ignatzschineria cameli]PWD83320.1 recombination-associated protein RdgC [Ignatzschineria cameli]PWD87659.1 recombination-associated protein RdgC [Ignatzschineria cameli]PWD88587.1 recombination-associated protein RdgC [Ignatzschineria cameli]PWD88888.1 recombination-associated protein RdgC [Ignatzschineria cameli]